MQYARGLLSFICRNKYGIRFRTGFPYVQEIGKSNGNRCFPDILYSMFAFHYCTVILIVREP